jgi:hypothetical protein
VHAAPPVRVSVGRSLGWALFLALASGAAAANLVGWLWLHAQWPGEALAATGAGALASAGSALHARRHSRGGDLAWDGAQWHWRGASGQSCIALDFDGWLLLRFQPQRGPSEWIAVARGSTLGSWAALRAALYSIRPADPLDVPPA